MDVNANVYQLQQSIYGINGLNLKMLTQLKGWYQLPHSSYRRLKCTTLVASNDSDVNYLC